ncbi:hypothetical protein PM082_013989 [Marasmius tenuissimus]|nr:hypothetical protein PM082_013989 [Marasmius tenuissimus]
MILGHSNYFRPHQIHLNPLHTRLREDYHEHHVLIHHFGFHNYVTHYVLTAWALGASEDAIPGAYDVDSGSVRIAWEIYKGDFQLERNHIREP